MKKKDIINAVDSKKTKNNPKKKESEKKKNNKKEKKKAEIIAKEEKKIVEENKPKEEKKVEVEEKELPLKLRIKKTCIKLAIILLVLIVIIIAFYTITEYKPKEKEEIAVSGEGYYSLNVEEPFTVMTWNIGYAALGDNADYFMNNGKMVQTANRNRINQNLNGIRTKIDEIKPHILFLQEVDKHSKRAQHVDEVSSFKNHLNNYSISYATNLKITYLAYPLNDTIGRVHSGVATLSKFAMEKSERIALPSSHIWPKSTVQYKRGILVSYIPIKDSEKKLVLMNVHLDTYKKEKNREKQIQKLLEIMKKEQKKGNYVIAGGDFNQTFSNIDMSAYKVQENLWNPGTMDEKIFGSDWNLLMDNEIPSCRSLDKPYQDANKEKFQYYIIDGYIVSNNIDVQAIKTQDYDFTYTDHNPVIMKISLKKE